MLFILQLPPLQRLKQHQMLELQIIPAHAGTEALFSFRLNLFVLIVHAMKVLDHKAEKETLLLIRFEPETFMTPMISGSVQKQHRCDSIVFNCGVWKAGGRRVAYLCARNLLLL